MSEVAEFSINLNSFQQVYYPGSEVTGYVVLNLFQPINMRGLRIEFEGKASSHWTEEEGTGDKRHTVSYNGSETYFNLVSCVFGNLPNAGSQTYSHPDGEHTYHFNFTLPTPLPSSFEGEHGHIRYILKAQIDRPWRFDHKVKRPIIVNEIIDINLPQYQVGGGGEEHKTVGCCCWAAGPLDVSMNIDRGGYCPGEVIYINAQVNNKSTKDMNGMKARLYQYIIYYADGLHSKTKEERIMVSQLKGPQILKQQFVEWNNQAFGIPAIPPTIFNSRIITVNYRFILEVDVPCGFDPCIKIPIVLGTVPHIPTYGEPVSHYGTPEDPKMAPEANFVPGSNNFVPQPGLFGYPNIAPPSYSAVVGSRQTYIGDIDDTNTTGELNYTPVYTFAQKYDASAHSSQGVHVINFNNMQPSNFQYPSSRDPPPPYPVERNITMNTPLLLPHQLSNEQSPLIVNHPTAPPPEYKS